MCWIHRYRTTWVKLSEHSLSLTDKHFEIWKNYVKKNKKKKKTPWTPKHFLWVVSASMFNWTPHSASSSGYADVTAYRNWWIGRELPTAAVAITGQPTRVGTLLDLFSALPNVHNDVPSNVKLITSRAADTSCWHFLSRRSQRLHQVTF